MNLDALKNRDYVILIDKSGSMSGNDLPNGQTRWKFAEESTIAMARKIEQFDPDGINVVLFNSSFREYENTTSATVANIFLENDPMGGTSLHQPLQHIFNSYLKRKAAGQTQPNGEILVVITDGAPDSQADVARVISEFTHKLDNGDGEYGILFCQVGYDSGASAFLNYLDNNLGGAKFDIVDTKTFDEIANIGILEALNAALVD
jgi:hypothetical protein